MDPISKNHLILFVLSGLLANYLWWVMPSSNASSGMIRGYRILVSVAVIGGGIFIMIVGVQ